MNLIAYIDGSSMGNPGESGYGVVIKDENGNVLQYFGNYIGQTTNNVAEYQGLIGCLDLVAKFQIGSLTVFSDSQLMVRQINGEYRVKQPHLQVLFSKVKEKLKILSIDFTIEHVPREQNKEADKLARKAVYLKSEINDIC